MSSSVLCLRIGRGWRALAGTLCMLAIAGCPFSPVGSNKSKDAITIPDADGAISFDFPKIMEGAKATFAVVDTAGDAVEGVTIPDDEDFEDGVTATIDTTKITESGIFFLQVTIDDAEKPSDKRAFLVAKQAEPAAGEEGAEEGASEPAEEP